MAVKKVQVTLIRGTVINGEPKKPGAKLTVDKRTADLLIFSGKARETKPAAKPAAKKEAEK